jgi:hypothetical protein
MLLLYAAGKLFSSASGPEASMASFQEGQACTLAGTAHMQASTTNIHFAAVFFMTIFLVPLFYTSEPERQYAHEPERQARGNPPSLGARALTGQYGEYKWYSIQ